MKEFDIYKYLLYEKKVIYIFSAIVLFSIIVGFIKHYLRYVEDNPDLYIPKEKGITI